MEVKAKLNRIQVSPRKVRLVIDTIRGLDTEEAIDQLQFSSKGVAKPILKLLNSAISNADNNFKLEKSNLFIKKIFVNEGITLHRWKPRAMGRATPIQKRSSVITIILDEKAPSKKKSTSAPSSVKASDGKKASDSAKATSDKSDNKKKDLKVVSHEDIKQKMDKGDSERIEQKEKTNVSKLSKFKEKIFSRRSGE